MMELSIESAFSTGGMVGHLSYLLMVISMAMRSLGPLRVFVILSSLTAILYDAVWLKDPVGLFWESCLVIVNVAQLTSVWRRNRTARFSPEEAALVRGRFPDLTPGEARRLLNRGMWIDGAAGRRLTTEGRPVTHLTYLAEGRAEIAYKGVPFTECEGGDFIGEMSVLEAGPASADATLTAPSRLWMISGEAVRRLRRDDPELAEGLEKSFSLDWRAKLTRHREAAA